ncbi:hypothetical protein [Cellulomonas sp.]|uniref:hypothetical protein n=1 Tax=Cellulomonas sp. TaxID=40001 RepID=UPI003BAB492A
MAAHRPLLVVAVAALTAFLTVGAAPAALADDTAAAWAVTPADAAGAADGRTRFELAAAAGETVEEHVLITNSSTVEREFAVYGADGFNTPSGGYDLSPAAQPPTDLGAWVTVASPTVTIPPLATASLAFTVAVPAEASPGDHPGGIVVSPVQTQVTSAGVLVDTRVAVRLNLRVAGELAPALEVREVSGTFDASLVPFASAPMTVTYEVVNTGNVKVVGVPRVRVTGPFGRTLASLDAEQTREVLPGDSFTVVSVLEGVEPLGVSTAVVDVDMAAAPGPDTEIPLVSSTARTTVLSVSWTGVALVVLVAATVWYLVRRTRRRRREGAEHWERMVAETRREIEAASVPGTRALGAGLVLLAVLALTAAAAIGSAPAAVAAGSDDGSLTLTVPPGTAPTVPSGNTQKPSSGTRRPAVSPSAAPASAAPDPAGGAQVIPAADVVADPGPAPDLVWTAGARRWTPVQWTLLGLGAAGALVALAFAARAIARANGAGGVS